MLTNSKSYKGRCYCLKVGSKGFGEGQICSLGKKNQIWISIAKWENGYHISLRVRAVTSTKECDALKIF